MVTLNPSQMRPHYLHFTNREMDEQKLLVQVITVKAGKGYKIENFPLLLYSEEWLHYAQSMHLRAEPAKQSLVDFALNFVGRMGFPPACLMLVWKWVFSSSRERSFVEEIIAG